MEPKWPDRWTEEIGTILERRVSGVTDWDRARAEAPIRWRQRRRKQTFWLGGGLVAASLTLFLLWTALRPVTSEATLQAAEILILDEEGHWEEVDGIFAMTATLIAQGE